MILLKRPYIKGLECCWRLKEKMKQRLARAACDSLNYYWIHKTPTFTSVKMLCWIGPKGLWNFMELLQLSESEVEPIVNEMVDYVTFSRQHSKLFDKAAIDYFEPVRQVDSDILWIKLCQIRSEWAKNNSCQKCLKKRRIEFLFSFNMQWPSKDSFLKHFCRTYLKKERKSCICSAFFIIHRFVMFA